MRHPASLDSGVVFVGLVGGTVGPGSPEDADPGTREDAGCVGMVAAAGSGGGVDLGGPGRAVPGIVGEAGDGGAEAVVAGPSEDDAAAFAGGMGDGADARLGGELVFGLEALAYVAELGEDLRGVDAAGPWERHDDFPVGEVGEGMLEAGAELGDLGDERAEHGGKRADQFTLDLGLGFAGAVGGSAAQAGEEVVRRPAAAIAVLGEKGGEALLAQAGGAVGCRLALQEGERDRRVDIGEDRGGAAPEALEQAAELVGQRDALGHQVLAGADERAQHLDLVGAWPQRPEAVAVGAQDVGEHVGVARIALAAGGAVAGPARLDDAGMDRHDRVTGLDQGVDDQSRGTLNSDRQLGWRCQACQTREHGLYALGRVRHLQMIDHAAAGVVDDAKGMRAAAPIQTGTTIHISVPPKCVSLTRAGRPCGSLIDWRSGLHSLALHPVVRPNLPAPAARRVARGPFNRKRRWPSRRALGLAHATPLRGSAPANPKVHQ